MLSKMMLQFAAFAWIYCAILSRFCCL